MEALAAFDEVCVWPASDGLNSGIKRRDDKQEGVIRSEFRDAYLGLLT